jgi:flagellar biosynthesis protein FlhB
MSHLIVLRPPGYGDPAPSDDWSRLFTIFMLFFGIFGVFSVITEAFVSYFLTKVEENFIEDTSNGELLIQQKKKMAFALFYLLLVLFTGAVFFTIHEKWSFIAAFYFAVQTSTVSQYIR